MKRLTKGITVVLAVALVSGIAWAHEPVTTGLATQEQLAPVPDNSGKPMNPPPQGQPFNWGPPMQGQQFNWTPPVGIQNSGVPSNGPDGYYCNHRWGRFAPGHRARCYDSWYSNARPNGYYGYRGGHGGGCWNGCW